MRKIDVLGTEICDITIGEAVESALSLSEKRDCAYIVTPNSEILLNAENNGALKAALDGAALSLADGAGVVAASRILGRPLGCRTAGVDFAEALIEALAAHGGSVFLLGGRDGVAALAAKRLSGRYPGLVISGACSGYFPEEREGEIIGNINAASPDLLMVCLGSPKQELWMARNAAALKVGVMAGLGGAIDVFAGLSERAPKFWREHGLEWLFRLINEPWRYKRVAKLPLIILKAAARRIGGNDGKRQADRP